MEAPLEALLEDVPEELFSGRALGRKPPGDPLEASWRGDIRKVCEYQEALLETLHLTPRKPSPETLLEAHWKPRVSPLEAIPELLWKPFWRPLGSPSGDR